MIAIPVIAIYDVGKTNKKFFLINQEYNIVLERSVIFNEIFDEDGDACEDVFLLSQWIIETLNEAIEIKEFDVKAVNFSGYGASLVYIDEEGNVIAPLYNYLKTYPEELKNYYYKKYGGEEKISLETASPVLGSLNSGLQLYRIMKQKPLLYQKVKYALHLPQYISYLFTKHAYSDITSIGCHTQLWNFKKMAYHQWVLKEGIDKKLAPLFSADKTFKINFKNKELFIGTALHDSSAALIPYLKVFTEPFILISTGTWCISLNAFNQAPLTLQELKHDCLCYMDYNAKPVKASRLFAGSGHEQQVKKIARHFKLPDEFYKQIKYNIHTITLLKKSFNFSQSFNVGAESSNYSNRNLNLFNNYEEAYHCLMMDIMQQQSFSTQLVINKSEVKRIFVDGGFSNNPIYMHLLSLAFPNFEVYAASAPQATAMGAALAIHKNWNHLSVPSYMVKLKYYGAGNI